MIFVGIPPNFFFIISRLGAGVNALDGKNANLYTFRALSADMAAAKCVKEGENLLKFGHGGRENRKSS